MREQIEILKYHSESFSDLVYIDSRSIDPFPVEIDLAACRLFKKIETP